MIIYNRLTKWRNKVRKIISLVFVFLALTITGCVGANTESTLSDNTNLNTEQITTSTIQQSTTKTTEQITITTTELPKIHYEGNEYSLFGVFLGFDVYEQTEYREDPIKIRTTLLETETLLYYVSGSSLLDKYVFDVDGTITTIEEVLSHEILTIEELMSLSFLEIKTFDYQVNDELYSVVHEYNSYLSNILGSRLNVGETNIGASRLLSLDFNKIYLSDRNPFQYPAEYEWMMTYQGYFDLAEELISLGYQEGEFISIDEFESDQIAEVYYRDNYVVKLQRAGSSIEAIFISNRGFNYYEYEDCSESTKVIGEFVDGKLSLKTINEIFSSSLELLKVNYEDYLEATGIVRVTNDYLFDEYFIEYAYGFALNETTDIMTSIMYDEFGYRTGSYKLSVYDDEDLILYTLDGSDLGSRWISYSREYQEIDLDSIGINNRSYMMLAFYQNISNWISNDFYSSNFNINYLDAIDIVEGDMYKVDYILIDDMYDTVSIAIDKIYYFLNNQQLYLDDETNNTELDELYNELINYELYGKTYSLIFYNEDSNQYEIANTPVYNFWMGNDYYMLSLQYNSMSQNLETKEDFVEYSSLLERFMLCYFVNPDIIYTEPGRILAINESVIRNWMSDPEKRYLISDFYVSIYQDGLSLNESEVLTDFYLYINSLSEQISNMFSTFEVNYSELSLEQFMQYLEDNNYSLLK